MGRHRRQLPRRPRPKRLRRSHQCRNSNLQRPPNSMEIMITAINPRLLRRTSMLATTRPRSSLIRRRLAMMYRPTRQLNLRPTASLELAI